MPRQEPRPPAIRHILKTQDTAHCGANLLGMRAYETRSEADQFGREEGIPICQLCLQATITDA